MPSPSSQNATAKRKSSTTQRTYVLDTSVLLSDPRALFRFAEHEVVLPVVVVSELEKKRHDPEIGFFARQALRYLDDLRAKHERLDMPISVGEGGTLRVELNHTSDAALPSGLRLGDNDSRILSVALNLSQEGNDVVVVSKDLPMRVVLPAFVISELRTAFQMGFLIFIPFLVIDFLVASTLMSMGMMMMPPTMVALPLKLLLFVLVDGWQLVVRSLVQSFAV